MRIVLIGAGSRCFGRGQVADLLQEPALRGTAAELVLVDESSEALERMFGLACRLKAHTGSDMVLSRTTDRRQALAGADYVIVAVARRRYELWEQDFRIPLAYGFRHVLGENGGPGAVFHALRSLELILPICRDMEELCPQALVLNFTNPESRVLHAICTLTRVRAVGICHGVFSALDRLAHYLRRPLADLDVVSAGINHLYAIVRVRDRATGEDLLPEALACAAVEDSQPLFREFARTFGVFTFPSEDHIGEYLAYGSEFHGVKWDYGIEKRRVPPQDHPQTDRVADYAAARIPVDAPDILSPSGEHAVPIICDIELDRGTVRPAVNVLNTDGVIENLPRNAVVEVPGRVDAGGVHPLHVGPLPEAFAALLRTQCTIQTLVTEAYRTRSRTLLLQALLIDPNVNSISGATAMLDDMLVLQSEYLPAFP